MQFLCKLLTHDDGEERNSSCSPHERERCSNQNKFLSGSPIAIGKINITVSAHGRSSCQGVRFPISFSGSGSVKVFTSLAHAVQIGKPRDGAVTWAESVSGSGFTACVLELGRGSNGSAQVNWLAFQSAPTGVQHGSVSYDLWTTGTKCKRVDFPRVRRKNGKCSVESVERGSSLRFLLAEAKITLLHSI